MANVAKLLSAQQIIPTKENGVGLLLQLSLLGSVWNLICFIKGQDIFLPLEEMERNEKLYRA